MNIDRILKSMLIVGGLGLYSLRDISIGLLEWIKKADFVFLEQYTSILPEFSVEEFSEYIGKRVKIVSRKDVEAGEGRKIIDRAKDNIVVFLTVGNPLFATTHSALVVAALKEGIKCVVLPSTSVLDGILCSLGLQAYKFGKTATLVFPSEKYGFYPHSTYYTVLENLRRGLHTLLLLDIKVEDNRLMTVKEAVEVMQLLEKMNGKGVFTSDTLVIGVARVTSPDERVFIGPLSKALNASLGPPPHSIVIPGILHDMEIEYLSTRFDVDKEVFKDWTKRVKREFLDTRNI